MLAAEDDVSLTARFNVRRAGNEDAKANELVGSLVAQQNLMLLAEARNRLAALEKKCRATGENVEAQTAVIRERRMKAQVAVAVAQRNIDSLLMRAPFDGVVSIKQNFNAYGGIVFGGTTMPDYRAGDTAGGGTLLAELIDTSGVEVTADWRNRIAPTSRRPPVDAHGAPRPMSGWHRPLGQQRGVAATGASGDREFDIAFDVKGGAAQVQPGVSAAIAISGQVFENAVYVPRAAIFDVTGHPTVYVKVANGFEPRRVKVKARTETQR